MVQNERACDKTAILLQPNDAFQEEASCRKDKEVILRPSLSDVNVHIKSKLTNNHLAEMSYLDE